MKRTDPSGFRRQAGSAPRRALFCIPMLIAAASCVHERQPAVVSAASPSRFESVAGVDLNAAAQLPEAADMSLEMSESEFDAVAANAAFPISGIRDSAAVPFILHAATGLDQLRSLDCLAQAIYYEARSEEQEGQKAVAQVVLNRLRHPSYPASVCGVVYQGPMRPGGGCQFTFTCDGSLARPPEGLAWLAARRIAADALAGHVFAAVGHSTHYHTINVFPHWAPRLVKSALVGSHIFYRFPGELGAPGAFRQHYAGREPLPVPNRTEIRPQPRLQLASLDLPSSMQTDPAGLVPDPLDNLPKVRLTERGLPDSRVRDAYLAAGRPRDGLPSPAEPAAPPKPL